MDSQVESTSLSESSGSHHVEPGGLFMIVNYNSQLIYCCFLVSTSCTTPNEATNASTSASEPIESTESTESNPLYPDSRVSADVSQLMLRSYFCRHHLTKQAQKDLLSLLQIHLPPCSTTMTKSLYLFENYQSVASSEIETVEPEEHPFCGKCYMPIAKQSSLCPNVQCQNKAIKHPTFIKLSIAEQLRTLLKRKTMIVSLC